VSGFVEIVEVGPRDGLQNEARIIPTADKVALVNLLSRAGFRRIEVASFVNPARVPQMADGAAVLAGITRQAGTACMALTPNLRGYAAAHTAGADWVAVFVSASEGFSRANLGADIETSLGWAATVCAQAAADGVPVRGYVSCVVECPYDGPVAPDAAARVAGRLLAMGCAEVSLGDTIGRGTPGAVAAMLAAVVPVVPASRLAGHFHDTGGRAMQNVAVALDAGLRVFDASVGGLGGCPFAPGAAGNVATGAVHDWLTSRGWQTGLDRAVLTQAAAMAQGMRA
jgi:hydroxymethylglutaryl-CoA lyase